MQQQPLCVRCEERGLAALGTELDHIVPLHKGGGNEPENLQMLCAECHREKTAEDCGTTYRPPIGRDGWPLR